MWLKSITLSMFALRSGSALIHAQNGIRRVGAQPKFFRRPTRQVAMAATEHFDYLVIGAGSGGMASARRAAQWGAKVAVVERGPLGGTCVNVGCVPKKVMFNAALVNEMMHAAKHYGFTGALEGTKFDWKTIKEARDKYILRLNGIYKNNLGNSAVEVLYGLASFTGEGKNEVAVGDKTYTADHVMIAVGGRPAMPDIPGAEHCIDSDGFFELEELPKKVAVVGAGYIAVELAGIFNALDSDTSLFVRGPKALRKFDALVADTLDSEMKKQGLNVVPNATPVSVSKDEEGDGTTLTIELEDGSKHSGFEQVVMAIGRKPLIEPLKLENTDVTTASSTGYIEVDEYQNTKAEGVYALGDVCGNIELTPMAIAAGRRLADRLFGPAELSEKSKADYDLVPTVVFSHPTIGTIGLTEAEAREKFGDEAIKVYTSTFVNLFYGPWQMDPGDKPKTAMKLVCLGPEEKVVGLHTVGMGSDEMLQGFGVALKMGCTKADLDACVAIHPTASEELVTMAPWGLFEPPSPAAK